MSTLEPWAKTGLRPLHEAQSRDHGREVNHFGRGYLWLERAGRLRLIHAMAPPPVTLTRAEQLWCESHGVPEAPVLAVKEYAVTAGQTFDIRMLEVHP